MQIDVRVEVLTTERVDSIDEGKKLYLELLDGKLLLVTNTSTPAAEVLQRYKSLADIERGFRVLKSYSPASTRLASYFGQLFTAGLATRS